MRDAGQGPPTCAVLPLPSRVSDGSAREQARADFALARRLGVAS